MCRRFAQLLLGGLFLFVMGTVAAFRYLEWWQAPLASGMLFLALLAGLRLYVVWSLRRLGVAVQGAFTAQGKALDGAAVDVHRVRRLAEPDRYEIELTVFPRQNLQANVDPPAWHPEHLRLARHDAPPMRIGEEALELLPLEAVERVENGAAVPAPPGLVVFGPERLRFAAEIPAEWGAARLQYYFEGFGRIDLPRLALRGGS